MLKRKRGKTIEKIVSISREKNAYKINLSSGESFRVSEDVLVRYRLLKEMEVDQKLIQEAVEESQYDQGYQMALNYLSYQLRSQKEIEDYLRGKEIASVGIHKIVLRLKDLKLIDDLVYAESYVRTQVRMGDRGPRVISQHLKRRGISEDHILKALDHYPYTDQLNVAFAVAEKAARKYRRSSHSEQVQKTRQYLMTKGFETEIINETLASLALEKDEENEQDVLTAQGDKLWRKNQRFKGRQRRDKVSQGLFRKGFSFDLINEYIAQKEMEDED